MNKGELIKLATKQLNNKNNKTFKKKICKQFIDRKQKKDCMTAFDKKFIKSFISAYDTCHQIKK